MYPYHDLQPQAAAPKKDNGRAWHAALHIIGALVTVVAAVAGVAILIFAAFVTSTCHPSADQEASSVTSMRVTILLVGLMVAAAPVIVCFVAMVKDWFWYPWAVIAVLILGLMVIMIVGTTHSGTFCL